MASLDSKLVPILVKMQMLQSLLQTNWDLFARSWNWVDAMMLLEHGAGSPYYRMLRQAMMARRALLLLDGLDEGGAMRSEIERHVTEVLAPQGHVMLVTSRPAGVDNQRFKDFHRLSLSPLTEAQQQQAVVQRLGKEEANRLLPYLEGTVPLDEQTHRRITANPLMLSMVISIFQIRRGLGMPRTIYELYEIATRTMIERAGAMEEGFIDVDPLLEHLFLYVHSEQQRKITATHLGAVARQLDAHGQEALSILKERVARDRMPLISLLQIDPIEVQASHLSFQEYFAAKAISAGRPLPGPPPWEWGPWWANTLKLGLELGDKFLQGLARASGANGGLLNLSCKLWGASDTALQAVGGMMRVVSTVDLRSNHLSASAVKVISKGVAAGGLLTSLDLSKNNLTSNAKRAIASAIPTSTLHLFKCDDLELHADMTSISLPWKRLGPADGLLLAAAIARFLVSVTQVRAPVQLNTIRTSALESRCFWPQLPVSGRG